MAAASASTRDRRADAKTAVAAASASTRGRGASATCKECGGGSLCEHQHVRSRFKDCDGSSIFEHQRVRNGCKDCRNVKDKKVMKGSRGSDVGTDGGGACEQYQALFGGGGIGERFQDIHVQYRWY